MDLVYNFNQIPFALSDFVSLFLFLIILSLISHTNHLKEAKKLEDLTWNLYLYTLAFYTMYQSDLFGQNRNGEKPKNEQR